jgi:hypothetical protein
MYRLLLVLLVIVAFISGCSLKKIDQVDNAKEKQAVQTVISNLWKAYELKDTAVMEKMFTTSTNLMWFGTDSAEVIRTFAQWKTQMKNDWELIDTIKMGELRNLSILVDSTGELASAVYEIPTNMTIGGKPSHLILRSSSMLKKENGEWRFVQGMVAFASVGQSSAELVANMKEAKEKKK